MIRYIMLAATMIATVVVPFAAQAGSGAASRIIDSLMHRQSINAVHFGPNADTWLEVAAPWNAPTYGSTFLRSWWERMDQQTGDDRVIYAVGKDSGDMLALLEIPSVDAGWDQLFVLFATVDGNGNYNGGTCSVIGSHGIIPRNGGWTMIQFAIDTVAQTCQYFVQNGVSFTTATMQYSVPGPPGPFFWGDATRWQIGGSVDGYKHPINMDYAEGYTDLKYSWILTDGIAPLIFATESGFARNLDWRQGFPHDLPDLHDCGEPLAGLLPAMCNRGDINFVPNGHEVSPSHFAYVMTEHGTLQPAASDPCLIRGIGDGCTGP